MSYKYYVAGKEITQSEKDKLIGGTGEKALYSPKGQPGIPFAVSGEHFKVRGDRLDINDQLLRECLNTVKLDIDKTFIIQRFVDSEDKLIIPQKGAVYGCW